MLLSINLQAQEKIINGRITDSDGIALPNIEVHITGKYSERVYTDEQGTFTIDGAKSKNYLFIRDLESKYSPQSIKVSSISKDNLWHIRLTEPIEGYVVDASNVPLKNIVVEIAGDKKTSFITNSSGYFKINNVDKHCKLHIYDSHSVWNPQLIDVNDITRNITIRLKRLISPLLASTTDTIGVAFLDNNTPKISGDIPNIESIYSIDDNDNVFVKIKGIPSSKRWGYKVEFTSSVSLSTIGRMPKLQKTYSQGQNNEWRGADNNEIFSWGAPVDELEYSGGTYAYDKNGSLVTKGTGTGNPAKTYDSESFFRTGISFSNAATVKAPVFKTAVFSLSLNQNKTNSPIPNSSRDVYGGTIRLEKIKSRYFEHEAALIFNTAYNRLTNIGASHARIMQSVLTTPPTFDNANGLSQSEALKSNDAWLLSNGSQRSFAPDYVKNPYYLTSQLPDKDKDEDILLYVKSKFDKENLKVQSSLSFNKQWKDQTVGLTNQPYVRLTRNEQMSDITFSTRGEYRFRGNNGDCLFNTDYVFTNKDQEIDRQKIHVLDRIRNQHSIKYGTSFKSDRRGDFYIELANKHYLSNTANDYVNFFPSIGSSLSLTNFFFDGLDTHIFDNLRFFGSISRSLGESPFAYRNLSALTTVYNSTTALTDYYEDREILFNGSKMTPETYINSEVGFSAALLNGKLSVEFSHFRNTTWDMIMPVRKENIFVLDNVGRLRNYGYLATAVFYYRTGYWHSDHGRGNVSLTFNYVRNKVTSVNNGQEKIAMSGFTNAGTYFAKNESLGTIYGTTYQRNTDGQVIIGSDGFPLIDKEIKKIGDPTPDFTMNLSCQFSWQRFDISLIWEYSHGGDRWNGTKAYLDYLGMSASTATDRKVKGYIFDGVDEANQKNSTKVDFYNSTLPISDNRWVRYGAEGVSEEYIEDASFLRLSNISLFYNIPLKRGRSAKNIKIGVHAQNLLLITSYKGVDPSSTLFGYATSNGLDLFNAPSLKSYQLSLNITF